MYSIVMFQYTCVSYSLTIHLIVYFSCLFFFFKQKTAYEMRISDWSSDVCSSDLIILTSVVLPEPLGPISPNTCPSSTDSDTSLSATSPPKCLCTPSTLSNMVASVAAPAFRHQAARQVQNDDDDQQTDKDHAQRGEDRKSTRLNSSH